MMYSSLLLAQNAGDAIGAGLGVFMLFSFAIGLACFVIWIWALVDVIKNPTLDQNERIMWVLIVIFLQVLGAIIYLLIGRSGNISGRS